jgi:two-component system NtrC family sensor kinase
MASQSASPSSSDPQFAGDNASVVRWLRIALLASVLVPALAYVAVAAWALERARIDAEHTAARASQLALTHVTRAFAVAEAVASRVGAVTGAPDDEVRADEVEIRRRMADMASGIPAVVNLNVWDAQGRSLARSDEPIDPAASAADRPYFKEMRDPSLKVGVSEVLIGRQTGRELFNVSVRRPSPDGSFRGVVAVSMAPTYFREYYLSLASDDPRLASFALIRTDGQTLARWPPDDAEPSRVRPSSPSLARLQAGEAAGIHITPSEDGREARVVSFRRVPGYPVYVVAGFSRDAMFADWLRFLWLMAAVIAPIAAGMACVTWVALKKTRLEQAASLALREEGRRRLLAEQSMMEAQRLETLAVLTGGVAHDFNNLLAIVQTNLHVHRKRHPEQAGNPQLEAMGRAIRAGVRLTRQLLSFSRKQALKPETIRLQSWLPNTAELVQATLGAGITAGFEVEPGASPIHVDAAELELALINLAVNAKHAMPDGGRLQVRARNAEAPDASGAARVVISVQDGGIGIAPEVLPRVIEPFFTTRQRGAGSGLGLSQVHGFCNQAGGALEIESTVGAGTTVHMFFPALAAGDATAAVQPAGERAPLRLSGRVLLVEDNEDVGVSAQTMLADAGLDVVRVKSAQAALDYLASPEGPPDVVLSDIAMPGSLNGIGLAFRLRETWPKLPVLLTTGYAEQLSLAASGGFEVIPKPAAPEDVLRRIGERLAERVDATAK